MDHECTEKKDVLAFPSYAPLCTDMWPDISWAMELGQGPKEVSQERQCETVACPEGVGEGVGPSPTAPGWLQSPGSLGSPAELAKLWMGSKRAEQT